MSTTEIQTNPNPGSRWWLPVLLALLIVAIILGAIFLTHPHMFAASPTATPTATPTPAVTATPMPGPTGTPLPGPTGTPRPAPTGTPRTGHITHTAAQVDAIQRGANQKNPTYLFYLDPFMVVQHNLTAYGFLPGQYSITSPPQPPAPTPTPATNAQGLPQVHISVTYQGKAYTIYLDQPVQQGPKGIWVIITIRACGTGVTTC